MGDQKKLLTIDEIRAVNDTQFADVEVPEWGGLVRIGSLQAGDMLDWVDANEGKARRTAGLRLLIKSLVDADGVRVGNDTHLEFFKKKDHGVINRIVERILDLNKLTVKAKDDAKNVSGEVDGDASPSVLH